MKGAAIGFVTGGIAGDSLESAVNGALFGFLSAGLAHGIGHGLGLGPSPFGSGAGSGLAKALAHGVSQGAVNHLRGGKFREGMIGGFFGHMSAGLAAGTARAVGAINSAAVAVRTATAAVIGGTISWLAGGKFGNGATTAAFLICLMLRRVNYLIKGKSKLMM